MSAASGYILRLTKGRFQKLESQLALSDRFGEPVEDFSHSRSLPLVCYVLDEDGRLRYLAQARRGLSAGTGLRRLSVTDIVSVSNRLLVSNFGAQFPPLIRKALLRRIQSGGLLTRKQFLALNAALSSADEELARLLLRYSADRQERIERLSPETREQLAFQKEAVATALSIAGFDRSVLSDWDPPPGQAPVSFLDGIPQVRLREDPIVANDLNNLPGFEIVRNYLYGATTFRNGDGVQLTVMLANRQPLEELTGADLIYYNETFGAMVMVQYKAMEHGEGNRAYFRIPNAQLTEEITRMDALLETVRSMSSPTDVGDFRLSWNPFFLKLCPRIVFHPDDVSLSKGMYIPLDKWKLLVESPAVQGERGGRVITFENVQRRFDNTAFLTLVTNAWIGSTKAQSTLLEAAVRETIQSGRAAVIAIKHIPDEPEQTDVSSFDELPFSWDIGEQ